MLKTNYWFYGLSKTFLNVWMPQNAQPSQTKLLRTLFVCRFSFLMFVLSFFSFQSNAIDIVTVNVGESKDDSRILFKNELVKLALDITKEEYGEYKIVTNPNRMNIARAFRELEKGKNLSLTFAHTRPEFEQMANPIRVSIRGGIDSYRLLVIRKGQQALFNGVKTLEDLQQRKVGLSPNWTTHKIMAENGFNIVDTPNYASMFRMLEQGRFDFMPRAINEVYDELALYKPIDEGIEVLPNIALYIPSVSYMFVSRSQPRIFQRLNSGLHATSINGDLSKLTDKYYKTFITRAKLQNRRIITIQSSQLSNIEPPTEKDKTSE